MVYGICYVFFYVKSDENKQVLWLGGFNMSLELLFLVLDGNGDHDDVVYVDTALSC